jgi:hypothetical protein
VGTEAKASNGDAMTSHDTIIRDVQFLALDRNRYEAGLPAACIRIDDVTGWCDLDQLRNDVRIFGPRLGFVMGIGYYLLAMDGLL